MVGSRADDHRISNSSTESIEWARIGGAEVLNPAPSIDLGFSSTPKILEWNFDSLKLDSATGGNSLVWITTEILQFNRSVLDDQRIAEFKKIFVKAQSEYNSTAFARNGKRPLYHNHIHGADVCQATHYLAHKADLLSRIPTSGGLHLKKDIVVYATVFASAMHDFDHFGLSNDFLIRHGDPLAVRYNDRSVLENHHAASAFSLLHGMDLSFSPKDYKLFRQMVVEMILSTDMHYHYELMSHGIPNPDRDYMHCLKIALHCADVSSGARPLEICLKWTNLITEEFFLQGDLDKVTAHSHSFIIPPMMDRNLANVPKIQSSFYDVIVRPLFVYFEILCPEITSTCICELDKNRQWWINQDDQAIFPNV